jgi:hypothetical protein
MYTKILAISLLSAACSIAYANNTVPGAPVPGQNQNQRQDQDQNQNQYQYQNPSVGSGNSSYGIVSIPSYASPLPAYNCPQGDSLSWSIGWNLFSYARSSTRTEMECLDKVLGEMRAARTPVPILPMPAQIHPVCTTEYLDTPVFLITDSNRNVPPRRTITKRAVKVCK